MADQGTGVSITFASGYFGSIVSMSLSGPSREAIDITTFATAGGKEFVPSDLYDAGEAEAEILFAPGTTPHVLGSAAEACTITWTDSGAATWGMSAFMTNINAPVALDDRVKATCTLKLSGDITITP